MTTHPSSGDQRSPIYRQLTIDQQIARLLRAYSYPYKRRRGSRTVSDISTPALYPSVCVATGFLQVQKSVDGIHPSNVPDWDSTF